MVSTPNIGQYWTLLESVPGITKRDLEAYFLKWAYEQGWYHMAVGFRSGGLDLSTFMGIPTLSIGLRFMVGDDRHELLATELFSRLNVQYDMPRHQLTGWICGRAGIDYIHSPYWLAPPPNNLLFPPEPVKPTSADAEIALRKPDSIAFVNFDAWTFEVDLRVTCERNFKGWGTTIAFLLPFNGCVLTTLKAQTARPLDQSLEPDSVLKFFSDRGSCRRRHWK